MMERFEDAGRKKNVENLPDKVFKTLYIVLSSQAHVRVWMNG